MQNRLQRRTQKHGSVRFTTVLLSDDLIEVGYSCHIWLEGRFPTANVNEKGTLKGNSRPLHPSL